MGQCFSSCSCACFHTKHVILYTENQDFFADWEYVDFETEKFDWETEEIYERDEGLENVLAAFEDALSWPKKEAVFPNSASIVSMNALFCIATTEMSRLAADGKYSEVDEIEEAVLDLVQVWGYNVFDTLKMTSFTREEIWVGGFVMKVGQYLKPEPLHESNAEGTGAVKLYCFIVHHTEIEKYICTYHLEYRRYGDSERFYDLKLKSRRNRMQITAYGETCPTYWRIRVDVLRDFSGRKRSFIT